MHPRVLPMAARRIRPWPQSLVLRASMQRRLASSDRQQPSNVSQFYKTFTRPVAKVLLMAVFTYQLAYWGWAKLEQDEIRAEREDEIASLEHQVARLTGYQPRITPERAGTELSDHSTPRPDTSGGRQAAHDHGGEVGKPVEYYQRRLMEVEKQLREQQYEGTTLSSLEQQKPGAVKGEPTGGVEGSKKTAPWWKVW